MSYLLKVDGITHTWASEEVLKSRLAKLNGAESGKIVIHRDLSITHLNMLQLFCWKILGFIAPCLKGIFFHAASSQSVRSIFQHLPAEMRAQYPINLDRFFGGLKPVTNKRMGFGNCWGLEHIQEKFVSCSATEMSVDFSAKSFTMEGFSLFITLLKNTDVKKVMLNKSMTTTEQVMQVLVVVNSNSKKGLKLVDENGEAFGSAYTDWSVYNHAKMNAHELQMRDTTKEALRYLENPPYFVIDFGAGTGQDTIPLLNREGFDVLAIDGDEEALGILKSHLSTSQQEHLTCYTGAFIHFSHKQKADLLISSFTWPYRPQEDFAACWQKTIDVLKPGGIIAGHFFAPPIKRDPAMSYHTEEEVRKLLEENFELLWFRKDSTNVVPLFGGDEAPWGNLIHVVARKK